MMFRRHFVSSDKHIHIKVVWADIVEALDHE